MIDVIERLQYAETRPLDADGKTQLWQTLQDARGEIERLRNQVEQLRSEVVDAKKWAMSERGMRYDALVAADEARRALGSE